MEKIDLKVFKKRLLELIEKTEKDILELKEMTKPISPENSIGRISRMDAINNKSVAEAALRNKKDKLERLKNAKVFMKKEDFGLCTQCHRPIQVARLLYMPESSKCVRCAR
jgi:DnaK suppressor protein